MEFPRSEDFLEEETGLEDLSYQVLSLTMEEEYLRLLFSSMDIDGGRCH